MALLRYGNRLLLNTSGDLTCNTDDCCDEPPRDECDVSVGSGGEELFEETYTFPRERRKLLFCGEAFSIPDRFQVHLLLEQLDENENEIERLVFDSGEEGQSGTLCRCFWKPEGAKVRVRVDGFVGGSGTAWEFAVTCDDECSIQCDCAADINGLLVGFEGKSFTIGTPGLFTERNESWRYQLASGGSEHVFTYKKLACGSYVLEEKTVVLYCETGQEDKWLADVQSICRTSQCDCNASLDGLKILFEGQEFVLGEGQVFGSQEPGGSVWFEFERGRFMRINYSSEEGCTAPDVPVASLLSAEIAFCSDGRWEVDFVHICNDLAGGCNPVAEDSSIYRWIGILCCDSEGRLVGTPHAIDDPDEPPGLNDFFDPNPENFDDPQCDASTLPEFEVLGPSESEEEYGFCENRWVYEFQCDDEGRPFLTVGFSNLEQVDEYPQCSEDTSCEVPQPPLFTIQAQGECDCNASLTGMQVEFEGKTFTIGDGDSFITEDSSTFWEENPTGEFTRYDREACDNTLSQRVKKAVIVCENFPNEENNLVPRWFVLLDHDCFERDQDECSPTPIASRQTGWTGAFFCGGDGKPVGTPHGFDDTSDPPDLDFETVSDTPAPSGACSGANAIPQFRFL